MAKYIDKTPPAQTGNAQADIRAILDYLAYLREQFNYIISLLEREKGA